MIRHSEKVKNLSSLCSLLGYTRGAFYFQERSVHQEFLEAEIIVQQVLKIRQVHPRMGGRKLEIVLHDFLEKHRISLGRDAFFDLLRDYGLLVKKQRRKAITTDSRHWMKKYPNLIRSFVPLAPNQLWVSDITYLIVGSDFVYLSLVTDAYSHKIIGHCLCRTLEAKGPVTALKMALRNIQSTLGIIHHSDRGAQYCCFDYVKILTGKNIAISMTENGDPLENAIAERVNGILKDEYLQAHYKTFNEARQCVAYAIEIYNTLRPHSSCDMLTPEQAHRKTGLLNRRWKNNYKPIKKEVIMSE